MPASWVWITTRLCTALAGLLIVASASAQTVVIYRCTDAAGAVTLQNDTPCAKGSKQVRRVIETAAPPPPPAVIAAPAVATMPVATELATAAPASTPPAATSDASSARQPPPPLYQCRSWDNDRYFSDDGQPPPRCVPVQVTGLGGSSETAAGAACQMVDDQCQRIAGNALCEGWKQRLGETESGADSSEAGKRQTAAAELARLQRILDESSCTP